MFQETVAESSTQLTEAMVPKIANMSLGNYMTVFNFNSVEHALHSANWAIDGFMFVLAARMWWYRPR